MKSGIAARAQSDFQMVNAAELRSILSEEESLNEIIVNFVANQLRSIREIFLTSSSEPVIWVFPDAGKA